ncbi:MAG: hypothetical protein AB7E47_16870 [Desulfovibrionaceae bacterium]
MNGMMQAMRATAEMPRLLAALDDQWAGWPFSYNGYGGGLLPMVAKFLFVAAIFVALILFLRFLFGPGGPLREDWIDEANEKARADREASGVPEPRPRLFGLLERLGAVRRGKDRK